MKTAGAGLIALLNSQQFLMADLYTITLADGTVLRYTSADGDITYAGNLFSSAGSILTRGALRTVIGIEVDTLEVNFLTNSTVTINSLPVAQFAAQGGFDGARLELDTVFMPVNAWGDTSNGVLIQFVGRVAEVEATRSGVRMRVNSDLELLNIALPRNIYQAGCIHTLYDARCTKVASSLGVASNVTAGSTRSVINCGLANASGYFDLGYITFTSGVNSGLKAGVKSYTTGVLTLTFPLTVAAASSDSFTAFPGCDKTIATCTNKFSNSANFRGYPFIPAPETSY